MQIAPVPDNEVMRLASLRALDILDSAGEAEFDALARTASIVCGTPISLLSLVDADRQWFKAGVGLENTVETSRDVAFCAHAILGNEIMEVGDAAQDARFADNPLVTQGPKIRFYAGAPVILSDGAHIGTLCVIDQVPRTLDATQRDVLRQLSIAAARALEGRQARHRLNHALEAARQAAEAAQRSEANLRMVLDAVPSMIAFWNEDLRCRFANRAYRKWFGVDPIRLVGTHISDLLGPALFEQNLPLLEAALAGEAQSFQRAVPGPDGVVRLSLANYIPDVVDGDVRGILVHITDITETKKNEQALLQYRERAEAEAELAGFLLARMARSDSLCDAGVHHAWLPAETFSGDLVAVAQSATGERYGMLADATGHGLAAAIHLIPLTNSFYDMAEKGYGLDAIARQLNKVVKAFSPVDRFVAVTLVRQVFREHQLEVVNAGNPVALLFDGKLGVTRTFRSGSVPLGILDEASFTPRVEVAEMVAENTVLMFSDGVIEACDPARTPFGLTGLQRAVQGAGRGGDLAQAVAAALEQHCAHAPRADDVTLLALDMRPIHEAAVPAAPAEPSAVTQSASPPGDEKACAPDWTVSLGFSHQQLREVDIVPVITELIGRLGLSIAVAPSLFTVMSELVANALDHGVLGLDSAIKSLTDDGMERYFDLRAERLGALTKGEIRIEVAHFCRASGDGILRIEVHDSGQGFDHRTHLAALGERDNQNFHGRGIALLQALCETIRFNDAGNTAQAVFSYR